jgi:glutathione peroxidase-family protein
MIAVFRIPEEGSMGSELARLGRPWILLAVLWVPVSLAGLAVAQDRVAASAPVAQLEGPALDGKPYALSRHRGKVVMVVFWSTACAVCRDMLPELRANHAGWRGKPFELVTVATDPKRQDVQDHERIVELIVPRNERYTSLWRADPQHRDGFGVVGNLPASFVIDREGRVVERFNGRIPAEAWDRVADLLP